jgi:hypothetical protein
MFFKRPGAAISHIIFHSRRAFGRDFSTMQNLTVALEDANLPAGYGTVVVPFRMLLE